MAKSTGNPKNIDPFTQRRLAKFIDGHRLRTGQLPTLRDLADNGFDETLIERAVRAKIVVQLYVTLTNGTVVKGYKLQS